MSAACRLCPRLQTYRCAAANQRNGPGADMAPIISLRQRLGDLARAVDEKLGDGAECALLQGNNSIWPAGHGQFNLQDLELRASGDLNAEAGKIVRERPVANRLMRVATRLFTVHLFEQKGAAGGTCG